MIEMHARFPDGTFVTATRDFYGIGPRHYLQSSTP